MYPIYIYPILAMVLPGIFILINRKLTWLSIPCTVIIEIILYWDEFCYYEARGLMIYLTLVQVAVMIIVCILLNLLRKKI